MQSSNRFAFKEWAVVCAALAAGRQSLILRKGGIHEGRGGFRVEHPEFWLFPTRFHQKPEEIVEDAWPLLLQVESKRPADDTIPISLYAVVETVHLLEDASRLPALSGLHIWSTATLDQRFHYRTPGLFVLTVRVYYLPQELMLPNSPHFDGCRSWVDLPEEITTSELQPVLTDAEFDEQRRSIEAAIGKTDFA